MRRDDALIPLYLWASLSLLLHFGFFGGTSAVASRFRRAAERGAPSVARTEASEVDFEFEPTTAAPPVAQPTPEAPTPSPRERARTPEEAERPRPTEPARAEPLRVEPTPPRPQETLTPPVRTMPRPDQQFVHQENPNQEPTPTDPHFLAQSNRNVEEETVAALRNLDRDQANPRAGANANPSRDERPGTSSRDVSADAREEPGRRDRVPNESRSDRPPERPNPLAAAGARPPTSGGDGRRAGDARPSGTPGTQGDPSPVTPGEGSVTVAAGGQGGGGNAGQNGQQGQDGRSAAERLGIRGMGPAGAMRAMLPRYDNYVAVFGAQEIERQREEAAQRRSEARGSASEDWAAARAAIENFTPHVRVGNQTALRTAASPFAAYLTAMHRRIHRIFADTFLANLDAQPATSPLNNRDLHTTLEIILERDGRVHRLGVIRGSGTLPFDVAAVNAVRRAAPFGEAPEAILSGDGRVYVHWGFYRGERQCGTFNAEPFILPAGGGTGPTPPPGRAPSDESPAVSPATVGEASHVHHDHAG